MTGEKEIWADDLIDREEVSSVFTNIVNNTRGSMVASVSAPFGTGKTFFATRWVQQLRAESIPAIYFNAWETDFGAHPLAAFLHACESQIDHIADNPQKKKAQRKLKQAISAAAPIIGKTALKVGARLLTLGLVEGDVDKIKEAVASELIDATEEHAAALLDTYAKEVSARQEFKRKMQEFRKILQLGDSDKNIVIVIDELERCRPDYSLNLLEDIKHFLEEEGFLFFIFCDEGALNSYADRIFGVQNKGEGYLRKFITHKFRLPEPNSGAFARFKFEEVKKRLANESVTHKFSVGLCSVLFGGSGLSLRQIERCAQHFELSSSVGYSYSSTLNDFVIAALVMREISNETYEKLLNTKLSLDEIFSLIDIDSEGATYFSVFVPFSKDFEEFQQSSSDEKDLILERTNYNSKLVAQLDRNTNNILRDCGVRSFSNLRKAVSDKIEISAAILVSG